MSFQTASLRSAIYSSALLDHSVPSSNAVELFQFHYKIFHLLGHLFTGHICNYGGWHPHFLCKLLNRLKDFGFPSHWYDIYETFVRTKSCQHICPQDDHPPFFVAKNVSMKKYFCICQYLSMRSLVP